MVDMGSKVQKMNETRSLRREAASAREEVTLTTSATFSRKCHHTQRPNHERLSILSQSILCIDRTYHNFVSSSLPSFVCSFSVTFSCRSNGATLKDES